MKGIERKRPRKSAKEAAPCGAVPTVTDPADRLLGPIGAVKGVGPKSPGPSNGGAYGDRGSPLSHSGAVRGQEAHSDHSRDRRGRGERARGPGRRFRAGLFPRQPEEALSGQDRGRHRGGDPEVVSFWQAWITAMCRKGNILFVAGRGPVWGRPSDRAPEGNGHG